ncbi:hypothetical protein ACFVFS_18880 [Kitasatospora sp. NPDC057692]|uniref:hypothetical protein n=1 Tax=Kitasatospora sp. NPDC057692 TaxID=3346215 RepID=UPI003675BE1B
MFSNFEAGPPPSSRCGSLRPSSEQTAFEAGSGAAAITKPGAVAAFDVPDNTTGDMTKGQWCAVNSQIAHTH